MVLAGSGDRATDTSAVTEPGEVELLEPDLHRGRRHRLAQAPVWAHRVSGGRPPLAVPPRLGPLMPPPPRARSARAQAGEMTRSPIRASSPDDPTRRRRRRRS
jgi:hypothetical protein